MFEGQTFSQARVTATEERITQALGNAGYTFANASGVPSVNEDGETVDVRFFVDAGQRAYVRRISFRGNTLTQDEVLRREMRQFEGGWASTRQIDLSKVRLERLGYFKNVSVETPSVPGTDNQIDVEFGVEEQPSGSISATLGFAQGSGLILGAQYQENNVFGTGNSTGLGVNWSRFQQSVSFNFFDPYFTADGVSRGFNVFGRQTNFDERNIARYTTNSYAYRRQLRLSDQRDPAHQLRCRHRVHRHHRRAVPGAGDLRVPGPGGRPVPQLQRQAELERLAAQSGPVPDPGFVPVSVVAGDRARQRSAVLPVSLPGPGDSSA
ncbi:MAG: POTRA domain-containing protein [Gammaproteobacteria bacterium]|nr:POTRA domain-containing protein [Gammaproteobacteria bacterium]